MPRRLSIRAALFAVVAVLAGLSTAALGWRALAAWAELRQARIAQVADAGANRFVAGLFEVLLERVATSNALQSPAPADAAVLREIAQHRAAMRADFIPGRTVLAAQQFANREELLGRLDAALARAEDTRQRADAALRLPREARDAALLRDLIPILTASVEAALQVWHAASLAVSAGDAQLVRLGLVKAMGWQMRNTAGLERSTIAAAIAAGQPVTAERQLAIARIRAEVDNGWETVRLLAPEADPATHPALLAAAAAARAAYFEGFRPLADQQARAGAERAGQYPVTAQAFVEATTPQLGTLLGVMQAAGAASQARTAALVSARSADLGLALGLLGCCVALALLAAWLVVHRVTLPLGRLQRATTRLAAGKLDGVVPGVGGTDEVGRLATAIGILQHGMVEREELRTAQESERERAAIERRHVVQGMANRIEAAARHAVDRISEQTGALAQDATGFAAASTAVADSAARVSGTAERVLADTQAGAAATQQLAANIGVVTAQVVAATGAARRAVERVEASQATIGGLSQAAGRIGDVVRLIADIAARTNLLALNATIEAARAGEAGKGFTVVAAEVKGLAAQTAHATQEIARQVAGIVGATDQAVAATGTIGAAIRDADAAAAAIAEAMEQQSHATTEIASTVARTAAAAREVTEDISQVSAVVAEAGRRAAGIHTAAAEAQAATVELQSTVVSIVRSATPEPDRDAA